MTDTDLEIPQSRLAESAERVLNRALEDARRREHAFLTNEHVCLAFAQVEWDLFGQLMLDVQLNPHEILRALEDHMHALPTADGRDLTYVDTKGGVSNIWLQSLAGGAPRQLTDFKDQRIFGFAWSRDGKQLALSRGVVNSDVVLVKDFKP